jgi:hypothetical protein
LQRCVFGSEKVLIRVYKADFTVVRVYKLVIVVAIINTTTTIIMTSVIMEVILL